MAFIQCSLTGTALSWYIRLNDTYKQDWSAFVQAFKKQFSSQRNAYYAQVEALTLVKKDNETVRHFAFKIHQPVETNCCKENASTINLECNEIFTQGLPKNFEDFANKRQMKHTSTVLEPSIPFHTLVKLVDAEDFANDRKRTHDFTLEVNSITNQLQSQNLETQQSEHIMFTQYRDNNKHKPAYEKYCSYCHRTNNSISACFKKQRDDGDKRDAYARSKSPRKSFVLHFRSSSREHNSYRKIPNLQNLMINTVVEVHHVIVIQIAIFHHKLDIVLTLETDTDMTEILLLHNLTDQDMTTTDEIRVLIVHSTDLHLDHHIDELHVLDIGHVHTLEIDNFHNTLRYIDLNPNRESLDLLDLDQVLKQKIKSKPFKQNNQNHLLT